MWLFLYVTASLVMGIATECDKNADTCEFWLEVKHKLTMMAQREAVYAQNGKLYRYYVTDTTNATTVDPDEVVVADGWERQRIVGVVNETMPGPPIIVYEGQTVIIHVTNKMTGSGLTIHWHGLHQKGTPWMDGVAFVTQCPIQPYGTFTYKFKAYPKGTFWYHSHLGTQLSQGIVGAFIIREKNPPVPMEEHIIFLQEWNHEIDAELMHMRMEYGNYDYRQKSNTTDSLEGGHFSMFRFDAGLINGRGRFYYPDGSNTGSPLTVYEVDQNSTYRFRIIGGGSLYPFRVSVDGHHLKVIASDGFDMEPVIVESVILNPGERYDVVVVANQSVDNYWIRAVTLEVNVKNHIAQAIMRYRGASDEDPTTDRLACTPTERCLVMNCPYSYYPVEDYTDCMKLSEARSSGEFDTPGSQPEDDIEDVFLNFAFPGTTFFPGSANGVKFKKPPVSALTQPFDLTGQCKSDRCGEDQQCYCTNSITLQKNKVYQMIITNLGVGKGWAHPIHMHGHSFSVVKMGYPSYNTTTGVLIDDNMDVNCRGNPSGSFCNDATWRNTSWGGNNVPGLVLDAPVIKDTIIVPTGGYVVIRIKADNPGVWFMHCHIELHNIDGMAIMINESYGEHPPPPVGFQICGNFESGQRLHGYKGYWRENPESDESCDDWHIALGVICALLFVALIIIIILAITLCRASRGEGAITSRNENPAAFTNNGFNGK